MPTSTWHNLDTEKRARVLHAALDEFATRGYTAGSLNTISRQARVSKGSLFQYFDDKLDLWSTVVHYGASEMCDRLLQAIDARAGLSFERQVHALIEDWLGFLLDRPAQQAGAVAINSEPDQTARTIARAISGDYLDRLIAPAFAHALETGALRGDDRRSLARTQLALLLRHLAAAPFQPGEDPTLDLSFRSEEEVRATAHALADAYLRAWTAEPALPSHDSSADRSSRARTPSAS